MLNLVTIEIDWLKQEIHILISKEFVFWGTEKTVLIPLVLHCGRQVSSGKSVFNYNPAARRMLPPVLNLAELTRWLQAQPLRLLSSAPVGSFLPEESALLGPFIGLLRQS